jgi:hypothetical protein
MIIKCNLNLLLMETPGTCPASEEKVKKSHKTTKGLYSRPERVMRI